MTGTYLRWLDAGIIGSIALPLVVMICSAFLSHAIDNGLVVFACIALVAFVTLSYRSVSKMLGKFEDRLDAHSLRQTVFLDGIPARYVVLTIVLASALSLILELAVIRWQGIAFEFFAFYKNFSLLSCFAGLGIGYSTARKDRIALILTIPILAWQQIVLTFLRHGMDIHWIRSLIALPVKEQLNVGFSSETTMPEYCALYFLLLVVLILTILAFIPLGQLCGRLMTRVKPLPAYGANLLGSFIGVVVMVGLSCIATPPAIWFALAFAICASFVLYRRKAIVISLFAALIGITALSWPVEIGFEREFSPYQILERGPGVHGWSMLRAAGLYYQRVMDLSLRSRAAFPDLDRTGRYYDLPYSLYEHPKEILVLGAGMGNDVAAALRSGAEHVDAVEIDPLILRFGKEYHPEGPYSDPRVTAYTEDARAYLRRTKKHYDAIIFGLLDSHALSSHASSLRLDSYVYTIDSFKEAKNLLNDGGIMSLSFSVPSPLLARKIFVMLQQSFDGEMPLCIGGEYDESFSFFQRKEGNATTFFRDQAAKSGFRNLTESLQRTNLQVDCSTDDWPFFYMFRRQWPVSYLPMIAMIVLLTYFFNKSLGQPILAKSLDFFFLGAGFMLIEAKAITELTLSFGNTWYVTGIVVSAIILMAFFANLFVFQVKVTKPFIPYFLLLASVGLGFLLAHSGGIAGHHLNNIGHILVLTCPIFFSGVVFSTLFDQTPDVSSAMSANLLGAMCGGVMEYSAMYLGYQALYLVALAIYCLALCCSLFRRGKAPSA